MRDKASMRQMPYFDKEYRTVQLKFNINNAFVSHGEKLCPRDTVSDEVRKIKLS